MKYLILLLCALLLIGAMPPPEGFILYGSMTAIYETGAGLYAMKFLHALEYIETGEWECVFEVYSWPDREVYYTFNMPSGAIYPESYLRPSVECIADDYRMYAVLQSAEKEFVSPGPMFVDMTEAVSYFANADGLVYTLSWMPVEGGCMVSIEGDSGFSYFVPDRHGYYSYGVEPFFMCYREGPSIVDDVIFVEFMSYVPWVMR